MIKHKIRKILLLGSGGLKIGQAGEFDYSGSQAIKALKEEGIKTILINPNIATIQTSKDMADKIYFLPVEPFFVEQVIKKENPDGILLAFGGQTALNCGVELEKKGVFKKYNVKVLGTQVKAIEDTEDRDLFIKKLNEVNVKTAKSFAVSSIGEALKAAEKIGYPVMARVAYALGGRGSGIARNKKELTSMAKKAFAYTPQILIEEWLGGWKEVEYEVVRDDQDNCITVCNMENFDPMGIHTGESIVVAPSQTLNNHEYHRLRDVAIRVVRHLGIVGECNIQYALDPKSDDYRVIEVNARLSRSSALASKATGYPLAFVAAKLALGYTLVELSNSITKVTTACFEPALDYIVVKIPRWDLKKFKQVSKEIGSEMKSVGEVMAIGRSFEETFQKAIRMLGVGMEGVVCNNLLLGDVKKEIRQPTDKRVFAIAEAISKGMDVDEIHSLSGIDKWFLYKIKNIVETKRKLSKSSIKKLSKELLIEAKKQGFSDRQVAILVKSDELKVRKLRKKLKVLPVVKQIDTLAAEWPAKTNYLYLTYHGTKDDIDFKNKNSVIVLGSGAYRIGSSVEFDWCCVNAVLTLKKLKYNTIMVNYNPETVSTDYDICDRLYFDELSFERVLDINDKEKAVGTIVSMGGQIPNNLALPLFKQGVKILGTSPKSIDNAEDRYKFSKLLDELKVDQPGWEELTSTEEAVVFANKVDYPVLIRPSYVLSGAAMNVASNPEELKNYLKQAADVSKKHPVVISKFIKNAKEIELDAVADKGELIISAISEHIENAGVHSGDATMVLPAQRTYIETMRRIKDIARKIAGSLKITGPFNIQFIAKDNEIKVIECNLRSSRSFPFVSKVMKVNFIDLATKVMSGKKITKANKSSIDLDYVGIKVPQFSFSRLKGADPVLGVEMASTGEVACFGEDVQEAYLKSLLSAGFELPKKNILVSIGGDENRYRLLNSIKTLFELGYKIYATEHTSYFLEDNGIKNTMLYKVHEKMMSEHRLRESLKEFARFKFGKFLRRQFNIHKHGNIGDFLTEKKLDLVIMIPKHNERSDDKYTIRRLAVDFSIPLLTNLQVVKLFVESIAKYKLEDLKVKSWEEYN